VKTNHPVSVQYSVVEPEPHHFDGAGAVTRGGLGSDLSSSQHDVLHIHLNTRYDMAQDAEAYDVNATQ
jgi:hypothetical protein